MWVRVTWECSRSFESFSARISKWSVSEKQVTAKWNGIKFGDQGILALHIWASMYIDLVVFKVILGCFSAIVSNLSLIPSNICERFGSVLRTAVVKQSAGRNVPWYSASVKKFWLILYSSSVSVKFIYSHQPFLISLFQHKMCGLPHTRRHQLVLFQIHIIIVG